MANKEHVAMLPLMTDSSEVKTAKARKFNKWRNENPNVVLDLEGANLRDVAFVDTGLNLRGANLRDAWFTEGMAFTSTQVGYADLREADFTGAHIMWCQFYQSNLAGAIFDLDGGINVYGVNLWGAINPPPEFVEAMIKAMRKSICHR